MLPSIVANEFQESVSALLHSAFPITTPFFQRSGQENADHQALINDLIERPCTLFKGPYLDIKLPFRRAPDDVLPLRHVVPECRQHQHQLEAFRRFCGDAPQSTIVATGSGKTECFMLPVIDYCIERRQKGIKTIIVYPMNALATDQARRIARLVARQSIQITVGLFVGGEQENAQEFPQWPDRFEERLDSQRYDHMEDYLTHQVPLWFPGLPPDRTPLFNARDEARRAKAGRQLGELLPGLRALHILMECFHE